MGDRANVIVKDGDSTVYLYTHWSGSDLPRLVQAALERAYKGNRLDDGPYLARIVFCEMLKQDSLDGLTGFGISSTLGDGGDAPDITLSVDSQTMTIGSKKPREFGDILGLPAVAP